MYKSLIYNSRLGKKVGRWRHAEANNEEEAVEKFTALCCHLCHGKKDAFAFTKPIKED